MIDTLCDRALPTRSRDSSASQRNPRGSRPTASRPRHLPGVQIDPDDLVADSHGHEGRRAVSRHRDAARLRADVDATGRRRSCRPSSRGCQIVAVPVSDHPAPTVAREGHSRGLIAGLELVEHPRGLGIHQRHRSRGLVGDQQVARRRPTLPARSANDAAPPAMWSGSGQDQGRLRRRRWSTARKKQRSTPA